MSNVEELEKKIDEIIKVQSDTIEGTPIYLKEGTATKKLLALIDQQAREARMDELETMLNIMHVMLDDLTPPAAEWPDIDPLILVNVIEHRIKELTHE